MSIYARQESSSVLFYLRHSTVVAVVACPTMNVCEIIEIIYQLSMRAVGKLRSRRQDRARERERYRTKTGVMEWENLRQREIQKDLCPHVLLQITY